MSSKEENKTSSEFTDTAASQFLPARSLPSTSFVKNQYPPSSDILEDQVTRIKENLTISNEFLKSLSVNEELKKYVNEVQEELEVVMSRATNQLNNVKDSFETNFSSLERELAAYRKAWKVVKEKAQGHLSDEICLFKGNIYHNEKALAKMLASTTSDLKCKKDTIKNEIKATKAARNGGKTGLMGLIQTGRVKLEEITGEERKRRSQYEHIVLGLLDRTVDQGERIMRRIC